MTRLFDYSILDPTNGNYFSSMVTIIKRSNVIDVDSVQTLEEPEDMSIYCVCCSKYYGLISGK